MAGGCAAATFFNDRAVAYKGGNLIATGGVKSIFLTPGFSLTAEVVQATNSSGGILSGVLRSPLRPVVMTHPHGPECGCASSPSISRMGAA
jgi:hypothetical protein